MSKHVVIDPITRIEGHLRIEAVIDENNVITEAFSSSTMFRGIEEILKGRDPRDCGLLAMRICGVCTGTHYQDLLKQLNMHLILLFQRMQDQLEI